MKIKTGDKVQIMQGKDKGKQGSIDKILKSKNTALIGGINIYKKHVKKSGDMPGGIMDINKPVNLSNLVLICPKCNLKTKAVPIIKNSKKLRVCKKCKQEI